MMQSKTLTIAFALVSTGTLLGAAALYKTTALSLGLFGGVGVPCYLLAAGLYVYEVLQDLKRHGVL